MHKGALERKKYEQAVADGYALQQANTDLERQRDTLQDNLDKAVGKTIDQKRLLDEAYRKLAESSAEAGALKSDMVKMQDDVARLELAMDEMTQRENQAKASLEAFKELVQKFQGAHRCRYTTCQSRRWIDDCGTCHRYPISTWKGCVVQGGVTAISEVANVLNCGRTPGSGGRTYPDNADKNAKFPTNWHLGAARAIAVTKILIDSGLDAETEFRQVLCRHPASGYQSDKRRTVS